MTEKIKALFVFEILGKPPEHVKQTLSDLINKLEELKGIEVTNKTIHEPKPIEKKDNQIQDLFTNFAEVEVLADELNSLIAIVFHAMPSHIEIIEPNDFKMKNFDISTMLSDLTTKLHKYDEIAKAIIIEKGILINKLKEAEEKLKNFEDEIKDDAGENGEKNS